MVCSPHVIARDISPVAISVTFPVILRKRCDRRISVGEYTMRFFTALRMAEKARGSSGWQPSRVLVIGAWSFEFV